MKLEQSFEVEAPVEAVWSTLIDVERVAPCLPGAEITDAKEDGSYEGSFQVKLGPTTAAYTGRLSMELLDEDARRATMKASGRDKRGQGSANATIVSTVYEAGDGTRVEVETDFTITGRLARFGRGGMIEDISNRLLRDFAECLQRSLAAKEEPENAAEPTASPAARPGAGGAGGPKPSAPARPSPAAEPAKPVRGISLFFSVLIERIKRLIAERRSR
jgi:carbon monoxide dehydrogenase subunit G